MPVALRHPGGGFVAIEQGRQAFGVVLGFLGIKKTLQAESSQFCSAVTQHRGHGFVGFQPLFAEIHAGQLGHRHADTGILE